MKYIKFLVLILLLVQIAASQEENFNKYTWLKVNVNVSSEVSPVSRLDSEFDYLSSDVMLYPITDKQQDLLDIKPYSTYANFKIKNNIITYLWNRIFDRDEYGYSSYVKTKNVIVPVREKVKFPLKVSDELLPYTKPSKYIDITQDITKKANEIVENEDDLYAAVFKLADWTRNNINYNLSTLTAETTQKSSWVLENKQGVCDELTGLFISMLRSVGIPARFVTGTSYTNLLYNWGNHGWAEIYFPGYGWIPFDVTYGQYGWIDPGHVKLAEGIDPEEPSIKYAWRASNVEIKTGDIRINTSLNSKGETVAQLVKLKIIPLKNNVGEGSYVPVKLIVENLQPFYLPVTLNVIKSPPNLTEKSKSLLLKPRQQKSVFWKIKILDKLEKGYAYSSVFEVSDLFGSVDSTKIKYASGNKIVSEEEADKIIEENTEKEEKTYSNRLDMDCYTGRDYYYIYEKEIVITCDLRNKGDTRIDRIDVCLNNSCGNTSLDVMVIKNVKFIVKPENNTFFVVNAKGDNVDLNRYININVITSPNLRISDINYPDLVSYKGNANISFVLNMDAPVVGVNGRINGKAMFNIDKLTGSERIIVIMKGRDLYDRNEIKLNYRDENGVKYEVQDDFSINVIDMPWYRKVINILRNII